MSSEPPAETQSEPETEPEAARALSDLRFRALIHHSHDLVSIYDASGAFVYASPSHERVLGFTADELVGRNPLDFLHPDERDDVLKAFEHQIVGVAPPAPVEHRMRCKDGSWRYLEAVAMDLTDDPAVGGILVNTRDVTDRRHVELLAADQAHILERIARGAPLAETLDSVIAMMERWMPGGLGAIGVVDESEQSFRLIAAPNVPSECRAAVESYPLDPHDRPEYPFELVAERVGFDMRRPSTAETLDKHGFRTFWACRMMHADGVGRLGGVVFLRPDEVPPTDADRRMLDLAASVAAIAIERDRAQARLAHQASHDGLTGLPNREQLNERIRSAGRRPRRGGPDTALLFLDIDRFKVLNDSVGHAAGDRLLVELGARLQTALRPGDLVARFGGDEFVMVCEGIDGAAAAYELAGRVLEVVRRPFDVVGAELVVTASVGVAMVDDRPPDELLRDADTAMYWAKERGRARVELFDGRLRDRVVDRLNTERALRHAVDEGAFALHYQPVVALSSGKLRGFEALLRWPHPERGLLRPEEFLSVAEECGLMRPIDRWVRETVCRQAVRWREQQPEWGDFVMSVNLSAAELIDPRLGSSIERTISETGIEPRLLSFEITERLLFEDAAAAQKLFGKLRELGVLLALDDFGTGYSPLLHLKEFPIQAIKIDRAFVSGLGVDPFDDAIVAAVVGLARELDLFSVAEGVETEDQAERLRTAGCEYAQGHRFAPAMSVAEVEESLGGRTSL